MRFLIAVCAYLWIHASGIAADPQGSVFLLGEFSAGSSVIPYRPELTVRAAITAAGGVSELAATPIYVIRDGAILFKSYGSKIFGADAPNNVALQAGDVIHAGLIQTRK